MLNHVSARVASRCLLVAFVLLLGAASAPASSARLLDIRMDPKAEYTRFVAEFSGDITYSTFDEQIKHGYFYVDIKGASLSGVKRRDMLLEDQRVLNVLVRPYPESEILRFVFNTDGVHPVKVDEIAKPTRLIIDVFDPGKLPPDEQRAIQEAQVPGRIVATSSVKAVPVVNRYRPPLYSKSAKKPFLVVIDPGHGGTSKGAAALEKIRGKQWLEKDLALAISHELKRLIDADPNMACVMTRTTDKSMSLEERVEFAERLRADFFVSVHLNSVAKQSANRAAGIEVYYLSERGEERLVSRIVDSIAGGPKRVVASIKRNARSKAARLVERSRAWSELFQAEWMKIPYFRSHSRGIKQANFWVLKNSYMPAVLVEVCFISNPGDLRFIIDRRNQMTTAKAMYEALRGYRDRYAAR